MGAQSGMAEYIEYIKTAVLSAIRNAPSLLPVLLYDGGPSNFTAWFEAHGRSRLLGSMKIAQLMLKAILTLPCLF